MPFPRFLGPSPRLILVPALATLAVLITGCATTDPAGGPARPPTPTAPATPSIATPSPAEPSPKISRAPKISKAGANRQLLRASRSGDLAGVRDAIAADADLEARNDNRRTALVLATRANKIDIARELLDAGADPNATDALQDSAFLYAGAEGLDEILQLTLEHDADVRSVNRYGGTALIPASEHAHLSTMRILIDAGVPLNHVNDLGWTALHETIVLGDGSDRHVRAVRMLLAAGADPDLPDGHGTPPRQLAADRGFSEIVDAIDRQD